MRRPRHAVTATALDARRPAPCAILSVTGMWLVGLEPEAMDVDTFLRVFIATFVAMVAIVYSAKHAAMATRDGRPPVSRGAPGSQQRSGRVVFEVFRTIIALVVLIRVVAPEIDAFAGSAPFLTSPVIGLSGAALMLVGGWLTFYGHAYMGELWRSGVPTRSELETRADALLQRGPYARSRNPIFLGVLVTQFGLMLAWPSVFTLLCFGVGLVVLRRQVKLEERSLKARFGTSYAAYRARTPRWI